MTTSKAWLVRNRGQAYGDAYFCINEAPNIETNITGGWSSKGEIRDWIFIYDGDSRITKFKNAYTYPNKIRVTIIREENGYITAVI